MGVAPIRVLHVVGGLDIGGIESLLMSLYRQIDRDAVQFDFVKHSPDVGFFEEKAQSLGARLYLAPQYKGTNHFRYVSWWNDFFSQHPEYLCVHGHMRSTASLYLRSAKRHGRVTICHSHSTSDGGGLQAAVKKILYRNLNGVCDFRFACSVEAGRFLFGEKGPGKQVFLFPNAIDCERMRFSKEKRVELRSRYGLGEEEPVIGTVGRLVELKNHSFLLDVFHEVLRGNPSCRLLFVGDGPMRLELEQKAQRLGLGNSVVFTGPTSDVSGCLSAMDAFAFPSLYEGFGNALIEAQANGLPCVVSNAVPKNTNVSDLPCYLGLDEPVRKWAEGLLACIGRSPRYRRVYADKVAEAGYDIKDVANRLSRFYGRINSEESLKGIEF